MSKEKPDHPAIIMAEIVGNQLNSHRYVHSEILASMLGKKGSDIKNFREGMFAGFTDDEIFIIPYLLGIKGENLAKYEKLAKELHRYPNITLSDVFNEQDLVVSVRVKKDYRELELTESQVNKIKRMILGKSKDNEG
jgi:hypothetical protein